MTTREKLENKSCLVINDNNENKVFGEKYGKECPICKKEHSFWGDMQNPHTNILSKEVCNECGEKLYNLIK